MAILQMSPEKKQQPHHRFICLLYFLAAPCHGSFSASATPQSIFSPGYPGPYENCLNCSWNISAEQGKVINLNLVFFDVERCCDNLTVRKQIQYKKRRKFYIFLY